MLAETLTLAADTLNAVTAVTSATTGFIASLLAFAPMLIGLASVVARFMPPPSEDSFWARLHRWINTLAQNSGYAGAPVKREDLEPKT